MDTTIVSYKNIRQIKIPASRIIYTNNNWQKYHSKAARIYPVGKRLNEPCFVILINNKWLLPMR